ncbi:con-Ins Im2-like [Lineus longissimus]|uniref:con-Ins Im2-like n=1 Tax=Lineus longissimus TaxID=88925 RepID=UPI002B4D37CA
MIGSDYELSAATMAKTTPIALTALLLISAALPIARANGWAKTCTEDDVERGPVGVCGPHLSSMLGTICVNGYYAGDAFIKKRSADTSEAEETEERIVPFISTDRAKTYLKSKRWGGEGWSGIVCECCYNRCTYTELQQYCNQPSSKRSASPSSVKNSVLYSNPQLAIKNPARVLNKHWLALGKRIIGMLTGSSRTGTKGPQNN